MKRLARLRVPLGFLSAALVFWRAQPTAALLVWGTLIAIVGEGVRIWAAGHLIKSREVTVSGPYRWIPHPLYAGSSIMGAGLALASGSLVVAALIGAYLAVTITAAIRTEERFLREKFGAQYDRYRGRRPAEAGRHEDETERDEDGTARHEDETGREEVGRRRFSVRQAIANREYRAVAGLVVAVLLLLLKATYNGSLWRAGAGQ